MPLTPFLLRRCVVLVDAVTTTVFNYVRRGLFERDKLTVATMLTLKILVNDGILAQEEVDYLVMSKVGNKGFAVWDAPVGKPTHINFSCTKPKSKSGPTSLFRLSFHETTQASMDPGNMGPLGEWLPETIWPKLKSLERIKRFQNIGDAMQSDSDDWQVRM